MAFSEWESASIFLFCLHWFLPYFLVAFRLPGSFFSDFVSSFDSLFILSSHRSCLHLPVFTRCQCFPSSLAGVFREWTMGGSCCDYVWCMAYILTQEGKEWKSKRKILFFKRKIEKRSRSVGKHEEIKRKKERKIMTENYRNNRRNL